MRVVRELLFIVYFCVAFLSLSMMFGVEFLTIVITTAASTAIAEWFTRAKPLKKLSHRHFWMDIALTVLPIIVFVTSPVTKLFWDMSGAGASGSNAAGPMFGLGVTLLLSASVVLICMVLVLCFMRRSTLDRVAS